MPGQQGPLHVRQHGLVEADDAGEPVVARAHPGQQVAAEFLFDGLVSRARWRAVRLGLPRSAGAGGVQLAA